jgi:2-methylcitrate dehydratase PrpD
MSTKDIAQFVVSVRFEDLPADVVTKSKLAILDTIGVMMAGYDDLASETARKLVKEMGGIQESTILGDKTKGSCNAVAFANAVTASTLDMDDGLFGPEGHICHPECMVIPSAIATSERQKVNGQRLIESCVTGFEVAIRAGAIYSKDHFGAMAGIGGTFGSAASSAKSLGLDVPQTTHALEIAEAHCPQPLARALDDDPVIRRVREQINYRHAPMTKENCGWATMTGVSAALLAKNGFYGPPTIFDAVEDARRPVSDLSNKWEILNTYFKPYSICRGLHSTIDGVLSLVKKHKIKAKDVAAVTVGVSDTLSLFNNPRPITRYEAQTSFQFAVAVALMYGEVGPKQIAWDRLNDTSILNLADKVKLSKSPAAQSLSPGMDASEVEIETKKGERFNTWVMYPFGQPENPFKREDVLNKFMKNTNDKLGPQKAAKLVVFIDSLEKCNDIHELIDLLD